MKNSIYSLLAVMFIAFTANAQSDSTKYGATAEDQQKCKECISLYRDYRDQKMEKDALPYWRCTFKICPQSAKTLYIDGAKFYGNILDGIYEDSTKRDMRNAYIDTLMMIYDTRIANFGEEGKVLTYKANDLFNYDETRAEEANSMLKRSMELEGMDSDAIAASKYYQTLYEMYKNGKATNSDLLVEYIPVLEVLDYNIARYSEDDKMRSRYESAKNNLDAFFIKIAECDDIIRILSERLAETPNDIELNKKALAVLNKRECTEDELYLQVAERVYKDKPTADAAYSIGIQKLKSKDYTEALKYFEEAADLCGDCFEINKYYLRAGQTATILGQSSKVRGIANKMLKKNPKSGDAYMLIGDAIASSAKSCDDGKLGSYGAYWLATDYFARAKSVDGSVASKANQKIASFSKQFPLKTDLFFHSLAPGDSYNVACFGENTVVRSRD